MSAKKKNSRSFGEVDASPTKEFFVEMLTRDISLSDAILDLLDNCVDGVLRSANQKKNNKKPYSGFWADIAFDGSLFEISDNCGGIPWNLHHYAFRMGRPNERKDDSELSTVGTYGIGMKRAIFKIGRSACVQTQNSGDRFDVEIDSDWRSSDSWKLEAVQGEKTMKSDGTTIIIGDLLNDIAEDFSSRDFVLKLRQKIQSHYARIISKGFVVKLNGEAVVPKPIAILADKPTGKSQKIRPYMFKSTVDGVDVFVTVGLREGIPSQSVVDDELKEARYTSDLAGWTVICNDRIVLYCNKDEETGWGEATVPKYHPQFIAISGVVEFVSNDARKLPTTTTKRGIDHSSRLYAQVKNRMREGVKLFTDYTNNWKEDLPSSKAHMQSTPKLTLDALKEVSSQYKMIEVRSGLQGKQFKPKLPVPKPSAQAGMKRISFLKKSGEIQEVSDYIFGGDARSPSEVGEACFDKILDESK